MVQIFIVMTFSAGMPFLYPIGMFCIFAGYWIDKYLFLRLYAKPPLYDEGMANRARNLLKFSLVIHVLISIYTYSNDDVFHYLEKPDSVFSIRSKVD
jgi:NhaP-type Na+/H+ or K+/H+ antiporter